VLSNTNLFTPDEQKTIGEALVIYRNVTTNSGPPGTVLISLYKTNFIIEPLYWIKTNSFNTRRTNQNWVAIFQYTNLDAEEEIWFSKGISARFKDREGNHRGVSITIAGDGSFLTFSGKNVSGKGILVRFDNLQPMGTNRINWSYKDADFSNGYMEEYMQTTNGMLLGKWLMWNPSSGGLILAAESKKPYDWNNHRLNLSP